MGVDGTYEVSMDTPMGKQTSTLTFKTDGDVLSGSMSNPMMGDANFDGGKVSGDSVEFAVEVSSPMGKVSLEFKGTLDGDKISGEVKTPFGPNAYEGARV
ncbi:MAG: hypothetical protein HKP58_10445 [Desulfatitalea sp.]|nr:hypothetical protein [Desulfatitalea sp.]NNK00820.1 hypothetical protein [Desulfatitalea sp.]